MHIYDIGLCMNLEELRWEKESQNWRIEKLISQIYKDVSIQKRIEYKNRILEMDKDQKYLNYFLEKSNQLITSEFKSIQKLVDEEAPIEQVVLYIDAPRHPQEDARIRTREDLIKEWEHDLEVTQESRFEDWNKRRELFFGTYPALVCALPFIGVEAMNVFHPTALTNAMKKETVELIHKVSEHLEGIGPFSALALGVFIVPLYLKWHQEQKGPPSSLYLSENFQDEGMGAFLNDKVAFEKIQDIPKEDQVLLKHLSQEKLRLFLLSSAETRAEILKSNPPSLEQNIKCLFAHYPLKGLKGKTIDFVGLAFQLAKTAVAPEKKVLVGDFLERLQKQREEKGLITGKSSPSSGRIQPV